MGLNTIFGINGIGKDTVAEELRKRNPKIEVTSMSRVLMYILGISNTYDVHEKITEKQYKLLEDTPQNIMKDIENTEYRHLLENMAKGEENVIFLAHLVSALRLGNNVKYLDDRLTPEWFVKSNKNLIQLIAPADLISDRRKKDFSRRREVDVAQISTHQQMCSKEWERILSMSSSSKKKMYVVENIELSKAVKEIEDIIYERIKCRNDFIQSLKCYSDDKNSQATLIGLNIQRNIKEEKDGR